MVRKFLIFLLSVSLTAAVFVLFSKSVSALSAREVLGDSTASAPLSIPPTAEGPGLILPDSPLFFLDQIKQQVRLFLAFTPEEKAKVNAAIAGERLAELRIMLARNNAGGIRADLQGIPDSLKQAANNLDQAKLTGRDISLLAKSINDSIKEKQQSLSILEGESTGEMKEQVQTAREALRTAKIKAEDNLSEDLLVNEIKNDLNAEIDDNVSDATDSAKGIDRAIDVLTRLASESAKKDQENRREALTKTIEVKNEALKKQQEKLAEAANRVQEKLAEAKQKALENAKEAAAKINEALSQFQEAKNKISE